VNDVWFEPAMGRWRDDKSPEDATTVREILDLYHAARRTPAGS
jgi:ATP-dependent DNA ligase